MPRIAKKYDEYEIIRGPGSMNLMQGHHFVDSDGGLYTPRMTLRRLRGSGVKKRHSFVVELEITGLVRVRTSPSMSSWIILCWVKFPGDCDWKVLTGLYTIGKSVKGVLGRVKVWHCEDDAPSWTEG